jgi:hypothetical protein
VGLSAFTYGGQGMSERIQLRGGNFDDESWDRIMALLDTAVRIAMEFLPATRGSGYHATYKRSELTRAPGGYACTYAFHVLDADDRVVVSGTARLKLRQMAIR